jgi:hypothetical protein
VRWFRARKPEDTVLFWAGPLGGEPVDRAIGWSPSSRPASLGSGRSTAGHDNESVAIASEAALGSSQAGPGGRVDQDLIQTTRRSLHAVAELVLAGPQHRASGTIRLRVDPNGFGTVARPELRVVGVDLVGAGAPVPIDGKTCTDLAAAVGVDVGAPHGLYHDGAGVGADEVLRAGPDAARWIEDCWAAGAAALRRLAPDQQPVLWPEHFDVGVLDDGIGYGVSPGDRFLPEPYAYVTPRSPRSDEFWSAPFGAARPMRELNRGQVDSVLAFFVEARRREADA